MLRRLSSVGEERRGAARGCRGRETRQRQRTEDRDGRSRSAGGKQDGADGFGGLLAGWELDSQRDRSEEGERTSGPPASGKRRRIRSEFGRWAVRRLFVKASCALCPSPPTCRMPRPLRGPGRPWPAFRLRASVPAGYSRRLRHHRPRRHRGFLRMRQTTKGASERLGDRCDEKRARQRNPRGTQGVGQ